MRTTAMMFLATIQAVFSFAYAQPVRCGTPAPSQTVPANALYKITASTVTIPVIIHVVYASDGTGNIADWQVQAQVDTLNATYTRNGPRQTIYGKTFLSNFACLEAPNDSRNIFEMLAL